MGKTRFCLLGAIIAAGAAVVWSWQPASVTALSNMDSTQRLEYLSNLEASDIVGYYCDLDQLPTAAKHDVVTSLRQDYGVESIGCGFGEAHSPIEQL